ncbi:MULTISPECIES: DeoR/GlpR family DNA-binding transcription regulator [Thermomonosporaceae]|uniref:DeoR/GlpR family DNA-binding transcription regulator n=1 Tax=Thermomonosporaceae TaxID=2012 RepID=UPI00255A8F8A|nr:MULTISPECIES: DeoR/GlpR family DNA-binding transcription regulator [Thermomonosporaceae]MDL4775842.1 DeoR/GlpR family DNA-binding transcription regulator [Actinomadura xylanilytica]
MSTKDDPGTPPPSSPDGLALRVRSRRQRIRQRVNQEGFVRIDSLAESLDVSIMTIHRDLDALESEGWLRKVRGGATAQPSAFHHGDVAYRADVMTDAKGRLAQAALELVRPGSSIMIDESTTCLALAARLPEREPLTVITNFMAIMKLLAPEPGIDLIGLGGAYYPAYDAFLGMRTCEAVQSLRADVLFMSTTAVTEGFCYHQSQETVAVKRALMQAATLRVLLIDHTKFGKHGLHQLAPLSDFEAVIVDAGAAERDLAPLRAQGVRLHVLGRDEGADQSPDVPASRIETIE